jgi:hypothetical protein
MSSLTVWLGRWLGTRTADLPPHAASQATEVRVPEREHGVGERGLPAIEVAEVIAPHRDCLLRLREAYGMEQDAFERDVRSVVERYAQYVHLLPATADGPFGHAGGLFRMGLDTAFYALQASDGAIFSARQTISARAALEPRWRYATFLAGLCSELYRSLSHLTVSNDHGAAWPAYRQPLALWLRDTASRRYRVHWTAHPPPVRALGIVAMVHVVAPSTLQYLAQGNAVVVPHLVAALSGTAPPGESNTLDRLVRRSSALVCERALRPAVDPSGVRVPPLVGCAPASAYEGTAATGAPAPQPARAAPSLVAPARLHPAVREALRQIIASLDSPTLAPAATVTEAGVFVPLHEIARHQVDPVLAVRALSDAGMLACDAAHPQPRTRLRNINQQLVLGIVLAPGSVGGLDEYPGGASER